MIARASIDERVREWGLREDVVEKDYVRFSEDLDFTVLPGGPVSPDDVAPAIARILTRITDESGVDFSAMEPRFRSRRSDRSTEGRVYYRGPRAAPTAASIKLDITADETLARPAVMRPIAHAYDDVLPPPAAARSYCFEEVFAEKIRAMGERSRPRDLYDIVNLYRRPDLRLQVAEIRAVLAEKCATKGVAVPTFTAVANSELVAELESEWANMLSHQLPALPPFEQFWDELAALFAWLDGATVEEPLESIATARDEDLAWTPPPTVTTWGAGVPLEEVRFAAVNHLCVELGYAGSTRLIEPYSLRRTREGTLVLHALRSDTGEHRSYRVDRIVSARATTRPFTPTYAIEFSAAGPMAAPPTTRRPATTMHRPRARRRSGPVYVIQCSVCDKRFDRRQPGTRLNPHRNEHGFPCPGRSGYQVDIRW